MQKHTSKTICFIILICCTLACSNNSVKSYVTKADNYIKKGKTHKAIVLYQKAIQKLPEEPVLYINQAKLLRDTSKYKQAIRNYETVIKLNNKTIWPYIGLARIYLTQKKITEAKLILLKGQEQIPIHAALDFYLGRVFFEEQSPDQALRSFNNAIKRDYPNKAKAYYWRGKTYETLLNDSQSAKKDYKEFLKQSPQDQEKVKEVKSYLKNPITAAYDF